MEVTWPTPTVKPLGNQRESQTYTHCRSIRKYAGNDFFGGDVAYAHRQTLWDVFQHVASSVVRAKQPQIYSDAKPFWKVTWPTPSVKPFEQQPESNQ